MEKENLNNAGDILKKDDSEFIYDFKNDEIVKRKRMRNPLVVIPEDSLRHSIINILAYVIGKLLRDYFDRISNGEVEEDTLNKLFEKYVEKILFFYMSTDKNDILLSNNILK